MSGFDSLFNIEWGPGVLLEKDLIHCILKLGVRVLFGNEAMICKGRLFFENFGILFLNWRFMHFEIEEKFCVSYFSRKDCLRKLMGMCKCVIEEKNQRL